MCDRRGQTYWEKQTVRQNLAVFWRSEAPELLSRARIKKKIDYPSWLLKQQSTSRVITIQQVSCFSFLPEILLLPLLRLSSSFFSFSWTWLHRRPDRPRPFPHPRPSVMKKTRQIVSCVELQGRVDFIWPNGCESITLLAALWPFAGGSGVADTSL